MVTIISLYLNHSQNTHFILINMQTIWDIPLKIKRTLPENSDPVA